MKRGLEGDIVFGGRLVVRGLAGRALGAATGVGAFAAVFVAAALSATGLAGGTVVAALLSTATTALSASGAAEELDAFGDDAELALFLAVGFPLVELEPAFDEDGASFLEVFLAGLGLPSPDDDVDVADFLAVLPVIGAVDAVDGDAEVANGRAFGGVTHFGVAGEVTHEHYFIEVGHKAGRLGDG